MTLKKWLQILLGLAVSTFFILLSMRNIDLRQVGTMFLRIHPGWIGAAAVGIVATALARAGIWRTLLAAHHPARWWNLFRIVLTGYLANNILPFKLGEVVRIWLLSKHEGLKHQVAIGTAVVERGFDLFALVLYFLGMMLVIPFAPWLKLSGVISITVAFCFAGFLIVNHAFGDRLLRRLETPLARLPGGVGPWIHRQMGLLLEGLKLIRSWPQLLLTYAFGLLTWLLWTLVIACCLRAFHLQIPFTAAVFVMVVLNFGLLLPASPGGIGVFEFMVILGLQPFGVDKETALGVGLVFHMLQYLVTVPLGWIFALQFNLSMSGLLRRAEHQTIQERQDSPC